MYHLALPTMSQNPGFDELHDPSLAYSSLIDYQMNIHSGFNSRSMSIETKRFNT